MLATFEVRKSLKYLNQKLKTIHSYSIYIWELKMGILNLFSNKKDKYNHDYRDLILYNGHIPFKATGKFNGDLIEFFEVSNPSNKILFNSNLNKEQYIIQHHNYDLVRNKDKSSFITFEVTMSQGTFLPTGRTFKNEKGLDLLWEFMLMDDPQRVMYFKFPINDNFVTGKGCLNTSKI